jgi:hypothetical protein
MKNNKINIMNGIKILLTVLLFTFVLSVTESNAHPRHRYVRHYYRPVRIVRPYYRPVIREYVVCKPQPIIKIVRPHRHKIKRVIIIR